MSPVASPGTLGAGRWVHGRVVSVPAGSTTGTETTAPSALRNNYSGVMVVVAANGCCGDVPRLSPFPIAGRLFSGVLELD